MGVDPQKAWTLFVSDPPDFLAMFVVIIVVVAAFVWWYRGYLVKERIATNEQRMALAREEHAAVTKQIEVLGPLLKLEREQLIQAREEAVKARAALAEAATEKAQLSNAITQLEKALSTSTLASTTIGTLSNANNALGESLASDITGSRDTPLVLKEWAKSQRKD